MTDHIGGRITRVFDGGTFEPDAQYGKKDERGTCNERETGKSACFRSMNLESDYGQLRYSELKHFLRNKYDIFMVRKARDFLISGGRSLYSILFGCL